MTALLSGLRFNHLGLALANERDALVMLENLGYTIGEKIFDPLQNVSVRLSTSAQHPAVETITPGEGKSPIDGIISKFGEMIYHTCYETDDLSKTLQTLEGLSLRVMTVSERKPAVLFGGRHVSFYRVMGWGIIELLENE